MKNITTTKNDEQAKCSFAGRMTEALNARDAAKKVMNRSETPEIFEPEYYLGTDTLAQAQRDFHNGNNDTRKLDMAINIFTKITTDLINREEA